RLDGRDAVGRPGAIREALANLLRRQLSDSDAGAGGRRRPGRRRIVLRSAIAEGGFGAGAVGGGGASEPGDSGMGSDARLAREVRRGIFRGYDESAPDGGYPQSAGDSSRSIPGGGTTRCR